MGNLVIPEKIKKGDTIGFVSPSAGLAPFAMHRITKAQEIFEKLGYKVKTATHSLKNNGYTSAPIKERVDDLHKMFQDNEVKMIIATIGGNYSNQLLKYLDFEMIKKNPKIFIGYSDITVLHYALQSQANLATYYGPCVMTQFGEFPEILEYTLNYFLKQVSEEQYEKSYSITASNTWTEEILDWFNKKDIERPRKLEDNTGYEWLSPGQAEGRLLGGAIPSINHLAGTKYWLDPAGTIFFIDHPEGSAIDKGLAINEMDSYLTDLDNLGIFEKINGIIIGRPYHFNDEETTELKKLIIRFNQKKCPILFNTNIGHTDPMITLRYGSKVKLDSNDNSFTILD